MMMKKIQEWSDKNAAEMLCGYAEKYEFESG